MPDHALAAGAGAAAAQPPGPAVRSGFDLGRPPSSDARPDRVASTLATAALRQFARCFAAGQVPLELLRRDALQALADDRPVDPNDPLTWTSTDAHATAVLRRHGIGRVDAARLDWGAVGQLIAGQASAHRDAGLGWTRIAAPASQLDAALGRAHAALPVDLDAPRCWAGRATSAARWPAAPDSPTDRPATSPS